MGNFQLPIIIALQLIVRIKSVVGNNPEMTEMKGVK